MKKIKIISISMAILGAICIGAISYMVFKENRRTKQIDSEIKRLQSEAEKIKQGNKSLQDKIAYLETADFEEAVAKEKMNLQKPDEKMVIIKPSQSMEDSQPSEIANINVSEEKELKNYVKWWNQFFKY